MASVAVDTKLFYFLYTGSQALTLNLTNAPWLSNVVKIIRPSTGTGVNTRQSYNGAYNGATPGGAVTTLQPGLLYEMTAGATNGWTLPNATRAPTLDTQVLNLFFPPGVTTTFPAITISAAQAGTYILPTSATGLTSITYTKNGTPATVAATFAAGDLLAPTATAAAGSAAIVLTLTKQ